LGVSIQRITPDLATSLGLEGSRGALVADVTTGSPAAKGGVQRGDVIVSYDGKKVEESSTLPSLVAETPVGETVPVEVLRGGKNRTLEVTIAKLVDETAANDADEQGVQKGRLGLALRELRPEERAQAGLKDGEGVLVTGIAPESSAAEANLQVGDVILEVNRVPVGSVADLKKETAKVEDDKPLLLLLRRADGNLFASLTAK
jgi:serine protease Do